MVPAAGLELKSKPKSEFERLTGEVKTLTSPVSFSFIMDTRRVTDTRGHGLQRVTLIRLH